MDEKGLKQWNATDYLEVYPAAYYRKLEENGNLFVLENRTDQRIVERLSCFQRMRDGGKRRAKRLIISTIW